MKRILLRPELLCLPLLAAIAALLIWPLALLVWESIVRRWENEVGFTLRRYLDVVTIPRYRAAFFWSVGLSLAVAAFSTVACLAPAWLFVRKEFAGKRWLRGAFALPMSFSGVIVGFLMIMMLGRSGFIPELTQRLTGVGLFSGVAYQISGLLLAYLYFEIPRATLLGIGITQVRRPARGGGEIPGRQSLAATRLRDPPDHLAGFDIDLRRDLHSFTRLVWRGADLIQSSGQSFAAGDFHSISLGPVGPRGSGGDGRDVDGNSPGS